MLLQLVLNRETCGFLQSEIGVNLQKNCDVMCGFLFGKDW